MNKTYFTKIKWLQMLLEDKRGVANTYVFVELGHERTLNELLSVAEITQVSQPL